MHPGAKQNSIIMLAMVANLFVWLFIDVGILFFRGVINTRCAFATIAQKVRKKNSPE
jgi:hypothetical protein